MFANNHRSILHLDPVDLGSFCPRIVGPFLDVLGIIYTWTQKKSWHKTLSQHNPGPSHPSHFCIILKIGGPIKMPNEQTFTMGKHGFIPWDFGYSIFRQTWGTTGPHWPGPAATWHLDDALKIEEALIKDSYAVLDGHPGLSARNKLTPQKEHLPNPPQKNPNFTWKFWAPIGHTLEKPWSKHVEQGIYLHIWDHMGVLDLNREWNDGTRPWGRRFEALLRVRGWNVKHYHTASRKPTSGCTVGSILGTICWFCLRLPKSKSYGLPCNSIQQISTLVGKSSNNSSRNSPCSAIFHFANSLESSGFALPKPSVSAEHNGLGSGLELQFEGQRRFVIPPPGRKLDLDITGGVP